MTEVARPSHRDRRRGQRIPARRRAGPAVLERLRGALEGVEVLGTLASPLDLVEAWDGAGLAIVVDAVAGGAQPGELHVVEVEQDGDAGGAPPLRAEAEQSRARGDGGASSRPRPGLGARPCGDRRYRRRGLWPGRRAEPGRGGAVEPAALLVTGLAAAVASAQHQGSGCAATPTMGSPTMARCSDGLDDRSKERGIGLGQVVVVAVDDEVVHHHRTGGQGAEPGLGVDVGPAAPVDGDASRGHPEGVEPRVDGARCRPWRRSGARRGIPGRRRGAWGRGRTPPPGDRGCGCRRPPARGPRATRGCRA